MRYHARVIINKIFFFLLEIMAASFFKEKWRTVFDSCDRLESIFVNIGKFNLLGNKIPNYWTPMLKKNSTHDHLDAAENNSEI